MNWLFELEGKLIHFCVLLCRADPFFQKSLIMTGLMLEQSRSQLHDVISPKPAVDPNFFTRGDNCHRQRLGLNLFAFNSPHVETKTVMVKIIYACVVSGTGAIIG